MGDDDECHSVVGELPDGHENLFHGFGIERCRDFVEQDHFGVHRQTASDGDALLLAARELVGIGLFLVAEAHFRQKPSRDLVGLVLWKTLGLRQSEGNVTNAKGERRLASDWVGAKGRSRTLRGATVTESEVPVGTVVCVHAKAMKESWCVVASEEKIATRTLIRYYAKRWGIETSFRDIKDMRRDGDVGDAHPSHRAP